MSVVRFIADLHFGHKGMATKRGFQDVFYHDEYIVDKWNSVVHKRDTTYILGDVTMETAKHYYRLDALNGRKIVVLGNHDMRNHVRELLNYVDQVAGMAVIKDKRYGKMWLTHCPIHPQELKYRVNLNIHGHIHENLVMCTQDIGKKGKTREVPDKRYVCVSCEHIDYTPRTLEELIGDEG